MSEPASTGALFRPGENCCAVASADRVTPVVDAKAYFEAFVDAAERAERSIVILAWDFDSRTGLCFGHDADVRATMGDVLNQLARRRRLVGGVVALLGTATWLVQRWLRRMEGALAAPARSVRAGASAGRAA